MSQVGWRCWQNLGWALTQIHSNTYPTSNNTHLLTVQRYDHCRQTLLPSVPKAVQQPALGVQLLPLPLHIALAFTQALQALLVVLQLLLQVLALLLQPPCLQVALLLPVLQDALLLGVPKLPGLALALPLLTFPGQGAAQPGHSRCLLPAALSLPLPLLLLQTDRGAGLRVVGYWVGQEKEEESLDFIAAILDGDGCLERPNKRIQYSVDGLIRTSSKP